MAQKAQTARLKMETAISAGTAITAITAASPPVASSTAHGLTNGDIFKITGITAGMVEVHMGGDDVVHGIAGQPQVIQGRQQARHREVGAGVDEGGAAVLDNQVGGVEQRPVKAGVDDVDATAADLAARNVALLNGPVDRPWGIRTAAFADPAGHVWEIAGPIAGA